MELPNTCLHSLLNTLANAEGLSHHMTVWNVKYGVVKTLTAIKDLDIEWFECHKYFVYDQLVQQCLKTFTYTHARARAHTHTHTHTHTMGTSLTYRCNSFL